MPIIDSEQRAEGKELRAKDGDHSANGKGLRMERVCDRTMSQRQMNWSKPSPLPLALRPAIEKGCRILSYTLHPKTTPRLRFSLTFRFGSLVFLFDDNLRRVRLFGPIAVVASLLCNHSKRDAQRKRSGHKFLSKANHQFQPPHALNQAHGRESGDAPPQQEQYGCQRRRCRQLSQPRQSKQLSGWLGGNFSRIYTECARFGSAAHELGCDG